MKSLKTPFDHNGECLYCDEQGEHAQDCPVNEYLALVDFSSHALDMLERVEWVRATGGAHFICPFCRAISERDDGPGHVDDCEGERIRHMGNNLRLRDVLR